MNSTAIDTGTEDLLAELDAGVLTLTLNRPQARNALSPALNAALASRIAWAEQTPAVKSIVLTGAGTSFCAGGDVKGMAEGGDGRGESSVEERVYHGRIQQRATVGRLFRMPKPSIAALPGAAAGAGFSYALACDLRIMSSTAFMTTAFAKVGFPGDYGMTYFLTLLVGAGKARELCLLSERITAAEALALGLTNWVCEPDALAARTREIALRLARGPTVAYGYIKENLNRALTGEIEACLDMEATYTARCQQTDDHKEASRAFVDKREPVFHGL